MGRKQYAFTIPIAILRGQETHAKPSPHIMSSTRSQYGTRVNTAPPNFDPKNALPKGFLEFLLPLHAQLTLRQQDLIRQRAAVLRASHQGQKPNYLPPSEATTTDWTVPLPDWCTDQRNQMTGPADDAELVVKMLNSGAPGVMLDLEHVVQPDARHREHPPCLKR